MAFHTPYNSGCPVSSIPWQALTHVVQVGYQPSSAGTLTDLSPGDTSALIQSAHSSGVKVLAEISDATGGDFHSAVTGNLAQLVSNVMAVVNTNGYDGVSVDWESNVTVSELVTLLTALRSALGSRLLVAASIVTQHTQWNATNTAMLDRLFVMTYDMASTSDPYSWFLSALYGTGTNDAVWSIDLAVKRFSASGVPLTRLNMGIPFYGAASTGGGITGPRQAYGTPFPTVTQIYYNNILPAYVTTNPNRDAVSGGSPWISIPNGWLCFDDPISVKAKVQYVLDRGLGGFGVWDLSGDYVAAGTTTSEKHPLLNATMVGLQ